MPIFCLIRLTVGLLTIALRIGILVTFNVWRAGWLKQLRYLDRRKKYRGGMNRQFYSIYSHGFIRAAVCVPFVRVAGPDCNAGKTLGLRRRAFEIHAAIAVFPKLGISV